MQSIVKFYMSMLKVSLKKILASRLMRNAGIYLLSYGIYSLVPLALLPILTRYLSPVQYGEIVMFQLLVTFLSPIIGLSAFGLITVDYFKHEGKLHLQATHAALAFIWLVTSSLILLFVLVFSPLIHNLLGLDLFISVFAVITCSANFLVTLRLSNWQIRGQTIHHSILLNSLGLINLTITLILVVVFHHGALGRITGQTASVLLVGSLAWYLLRHDNIIVFKKISSATIKTVSTYGLSLLPHAIGLAVLGTADRYLLKQYLTLEAVGIYVVAFQISFVISLFVESFNKAYMPWLLHKLGQTRDAHVMATIVKGTYLYFLTILSIAGIFWITGEPFAHFFLGKNFREAGALIGYLALGHAFSGMYLMVNNYIHFHKKNAVISMTTIGTGALHIILLVVLLTPYGIQAAALSYALAQFARFTITWYLANKINPMPWKLV
jgi:O-antigen/teichoic acid export membrane protein